MSNPTTLPPVWAAMATAAGGVSALAAALGVSRVTVWKYAHGATRGHPIVRQSINAWARRRGLKEPLKP